MKNCFIGIDVGSVSTNIVLIDNKTNIIVSKYIRNNGDPINSVINAFSEFNENDYNILGVGTTGSARQLIGVLVGADVVKNEITAHAIASINYDKNVKTILEIGGQDSKIIIVENGFVKDFAMNTVCAAGTGAFLDQQAQRLNISINDFSELALKSKVNVNIAGRCTVFAESDMIHKQQMGHKKEDIINGLCYALVRNYLSNIAKGKPLKEPIMFQGGVAANKGIISAFEKELNCKLLIPKYYKVMGAYGAAIIAKNELKNYKKTKFKGFNLKNFNYTPSSFDCNDCPNRCEIIEIYYNNKVIARWGDRCNKWSI